MNQTPRHIEMASWICVGSEWCAVGEKRWNVIPCKRKTKSIVPAGVDAGLIVFTMETVTSPACRYVTTATCAPGGQWNGTR